MTPHHSSRRSTPSSATLEPLTPSQSLSNLNHPPTHPIPHPPPPTPQVFVGNIGNEVSDDMLSKAFNRYPSFVKAKVVKDKRTGKR